MYMHGYDEAQLNGWFSKTFKRILKPVAHIGAAVFTGGASIPLSANMLAQEKARKAAQQMADDEAKRQMALIAANERAALAPVSQAKLLPARSSVPSWVVPTVIAVGAVAATAVIVSVANRR